MYADKKFRVIDPRTQGFVSENMCHEGPKSQNITYLEDHYICSVGFSKQCQREVAIWDARKPETRVHNTVLDTGCGVIHPYYDADLRTLYVWGQGNGNIRYYGHLGGQLQYLNSYSSKMP